MISAQCSYWIDLFGTLKACCCMLIGSHFKAESAWITIDLMQGSWSAWRGRKVRTKTGCYKLHGGSVCLDEAEQRIQKSRDDTNGGGLSEVTCQVFSFSLLISLQCGTADRRSSLCPQTLPAGDRPAPGAMFKMCLLEKMGGITPSLPYWL